MAIATLDQALAGMKVPYFFWRGLTGTLVAGRPCTMWLDNAGTVGDNIPGHAIPSVAGVAGEALTTYSGQLPFPAITGGQKRYLARLVAQNTVAGLMLLCDRLWHNSGLSVTLLTSQNVNSVAFPARDNAASVNGDGVLIGVETQTALGAGTPTYTLGYTNQAGTAGRTATNTVPVAASSIVGTFTPIGLQAGDSGVQSIQTFTASATHTSGSISLVAYRVLASIGLNVAGQGNALDALTGGFPELFANTVPFLMLIPNTTTSARLSGQVVYSDG